MRIGRAIKKKIKETTNEPRHIKYISKPPNAPNALSDDSKP